MWKEILVILCLTQMWKEIPQMWNEIPQMWNKIPQGLLLLLFSSPLSPNLSQEICFFCMFLLYISSVLRLYSFIGGNEYIYSRESCLQSWFLMISLVWLVIMSTLVSMIILSCLVWMIRISCQNDYNEQSCWDNHNEQICLNNHNEQTVLSEWS